MRVKISTAPRPNQALVAVGSLVLSILGYVRFDLQVRVTGKAQLFGHPQRRA